MSKHGPGTPFSKVLYVRDSQEERGRLCMSKSRDRSWSQQSMPLLLELTRNGFYSLAGPVALQRKPQGQHARRPSGPLSEIVLDDEVMLDRKIALNMDLQSDTNYQGSSQLKTLCKRGCRDKCSSQFHTSHVHHFGLRPPVARPSRWARGPAVSDQVWLHRLVNCVQINYYIQVPLRAMIGFGSMRNTDFRLPAGLPGTHIRYPYSIERSMGAYPRAQDRFKF